MALIHFDGFEYNNGTDMALLGWTTGNSGTSFGAGRRGRRGCNLGNTSYHLYRSLGGNYAELVAGMAFLRGAAPAQTYAILGFSDGAPADGTVQFSVRISQGGFLSVYRGTTLVATDTLALGISQYYYIELKVLFHGSTGAYTLRVGQQTRLSGSAVNTIHTANAYASHVFFGAPSTAHNGGGSSSTSATIDDIYVLDTSGSINNDFLGDVRVDDIVPNSDGTYTQFTPSTGVNHYATVDEGTPASDGDYNYSGTVGHKDSYGLVDLATLPTTDIYGVKAAVRVVTDVAGSRSTKAFIRSGTTEVDSAPMSLNTSVKYHEILRETDPDTSAAWTKAGVDAMQVGVEVTG